MASSHFSIRIFVCLFLFPFSKANELPITNISMLLCHQPNLHRELSRFLHLPNFGNIQRAHQYVKTRYSQIPTRTSVRKLQAQPTVPTARSASSAAPLSLRRREGAIPAGHRPGRAGRRLGEDAQQALEWATATPPQTSGACGPCRAPRLWLREPTPAVVSGQHSGQWPGPVPTEDPLLA